MTEKTLNIGITDDFKNEFTTLMDYEKELEEDLYIEKDIKSLEARIIINKQVMTKWMTRKSYHRLDLSKYVSQYTDMDAEIRMSNRMIRNSMPTVLTDREINKVIASDDNLQDLQYAINYIEVLIKFCESAEKALDGQSYDLKTLTELTLYQAGYYK